MNVNELQIGDWYLASNQHSTLDGDYTLEFYPKRLTLEDLVFAKNNDWDELDWVEFTRPIPLTAEILEKNGWTLYDDREYISPFDVDFKTGLSLFGFGEYHDESGFGVNVGCVQLRNHLKYVHELQNLIRSLEKNEFANNFKIK